MAHPHLLAPLAAALVLSIGAITAAETPLTPASHSMVIEWRAFAPGVPDGELARQSHRILAVNGPVLRYVMEDERNRYRLDPDVITVESYRGIFDLVTETDHPHWRRIVRIRFDANPLDALFPLASGKSAKARVRREEETITRSSGNRSQWARDVGELTVTVERRETIDVPAGRFDAYVLLLEEVIFTDDGRRGAATFSRVWYAPALGSAVRREFTRRGVVLGWHVTAIRRP